MSFPEGEPSLTTSFRRLLEYVSTLGEHVNQIYMRLGDIEANVSQTQADLTAAIAENKSALARIKETMITKVEFNDLIQTINEPFTQFKPPKAPDPSDAEQPAPQGG